MKPADPPMIVFYDGLCGFCDQTVQYILKRDRRDRFRFAPLQSVLAERSLPKHGRNPKDLNTLYLLIDQDLDTERVLEKSTAAVAIARALGGLDRVWAGFVGILPKKIRDWGYDRIAGARYLIFGKRESCRVPSPEHRAKFLGG